MVFSRCSSCRVSGSTTTRVVVRRPSGGSSPSTAGLALSVREVRLGVRHRYLDNQANIRTGMRPRWWPFDRAGDRRQGLPGQIPAVVGAGLNVAATNSGNSVEALQPPDASLTGAPVGSGRLGYELNTPGVQVKLGVSGAYGPRNDQYDRDVLQKEYGADLRLASFGFYLNAEYVHVDEGAPGLDVGVAVPIASERRAGRLPAARLRARSRRGRCARSPRTRATSSATPGSRATRPSPSTASPPACASSSGSRWS